MPLSIKVVGLKEAKARLGKMSKGIDEVLEREIEWALRTYQNEVKRLATGKLIKVRSGRYRSSVKIDFQGGADPQGLVSTDIIYAATLEWGATITPKRAKWLAIPLKAAQTRAGNSRGGPRSFRNTFFARSKAGNLILFGSPTAGTKKVMPLFVMKKKVKIKKRLIFATAQNNVDGKVEQHFNESMTTFLNQVWGR